MANSTQKSGTSFADQARDAASHTMEKGKEQASSIMDKARDTAGNVLEKAKDIGGAALGKAGEAASWVGHKADDGMAAVGTGMRSLGETIRDKGPNSGVLGGATSAIGTGLENAGEFVEGGFSGMGKDLGNLIRKNPVVSCLIGVGLGFILARLTTSSRS